MTGTRAEIRSATRTRFRREGLQAVSMRRIAEDVGVSATAIYRHYSSREHLLSELAEEGFQLLERYLRDGLAARKPADRVRRMLDRYLDFALDHPRYFDLMFFEPRPGARVYPRDFLAGDSPTGNLTIEVVRACMAAGQWRKADAFEVSLSLWAHAHGLIALRRTGRIAGSRQEFRRLYRRSLAPLLRGFAA